MAPPDIAALSASQQEALQTYISVTNQDAIAAIPLLQRSEWNVQIAIARFFDGEPATDPLAEARASLAAPSSTRQTINLQEESLSSGLSSSSPSRITARQQDRVEKIDTAASITTHHHLPGRQQSFLLSVLFTPFSIIYRVFTAVFAPLGFLVPGFLSRLLTRLLGSPFSTSAAAAAARRPSSRRRLPPADNARRFIREFGEEYGGSGDESETSLPFVETGFNLALDNAKKDLKFMLVVLLSPSHDDNASWVQEVLLSTQLREWLSSHKNEVLLWGGNVQDSEAYQVSASLQCTKFPFAALICHTGATPTPDGATPSASSGMTVIMRAVGSSISASELIAKLSTAMATQEPHLQRARAQQAEQQATRNLRQEQDSAYERSLAQDRERARRRREEQEAQAKAEQEARAAAAAAETKARKLAQWKAWRTRALLSSSSSSSSNTNNAATTTTPPPPNVNNNNTTTTTETVRVSIRMPSGDRIIHKLPSDADLEELYAFVECYDLLKDGQQQQQQQQDQASASASVPEPEPPEDYNHVYTFRLVSPMPRVVYELGGDKGDGKGLHGSHGGSVGDRLGKTANLIVEPIDDDDDDDDQDDDE